MLIPISQISTEFAWSCGVDDSVCEVEILSFSRRARSITMRHRHLRWFGGTNVVEILIFDPIIGTIRYDYFILLNQQILPYVLFENMVWRLIIWMWVYRRFLLEDVLIIQIALLSFYYSLLRHKERRILTLFYVLWIQNLLVYYFLASALLLTIYRIYANSDAVIHVDFILVYRVAESLLFKIERLWWQLFFIFLFFNSLESLYSKIIVGLELLLGCSIL